MCAVALFSFQKPAWSDPPPTDMQISIDPSQKIAAVSRNIYGSCIEDVNHEIYGGLYDEKLFGESFEEPGMTISFPGWTPLGGLWSTDGNICSVKADFGAKLMSDKPPFGDGTVSADIKFDNGVVGNAGLIVRASAASVGADAFNGYEISLDPVHSSVILGKHVQNWQPISQQHAEIDKTAWNHVVVKLLGNNLQVFVNGEATPSINYTDNQGDLNSGTVALRTWGSDCSFKNVQVISGHTTANLNFPNHADNTATAMWDEVQTGDATAAFDRDPINPYNGKVSLRIIRGSGNGFVGVANSGLNHWGISVKRRQKFAGRLYLRSNDLRGPVTVSLQSADGKRTYASTIIDGIQAVWSRFPFELTSNASDADARFVVEFDSPDTLWVDQAVLMGMGKERFHDLPVRADIANEIVDEGIHFLRYGGTMVNAPDYRWKNMIGDPDKRPPYDGHWYPYSTNGFGIFDFLNFCEAAHIKAAFAINIEETAADAADLADYLTAPVSNGWGAQRAKDGHPKPYDVSYIEIGNEEVWTDNAAQYQYYADRFTAIADAIHEHNPKLQLVCAVNWIPNATHIKAVFTAIDGKGAAWDLHVWSDDVASSSSVDQTLTSMKQQFLLWDPKTNLKCVIFEENGGLHNMQRAISHAITLNATINHADFVRADCPANCLQPFNENDNGWDQGQIFFTPSRVLAMPPYYAQQMASAAWQPYCVENTISDPDSDINVSSTGSVDGSTCVLSIVNTGVVNKTIAVKVQGNSTGMHESISTLTGALDAVNTLDDPALISQVTSHSECETDTMMINVLPESYTVVTLVRK
jgi:alpha-L-arabinofuranosidase